MKNPMAHADNDQTRGDLVETNLIANTRKFYFG
jgi:hypothetical protein